MLHDVATDSVLFPPHHFSMYMQTPHADPWFRDGLLDNIRTTAIATARPDKVSRWYLDLYKICTRHS